MGHLSIQVREDAENVSQEQLQHVIPGIQGGQAAARQIRYKDAQASQPASPCQQCSKLWILMKTNWRFSKRSDFWMAIPIRALEGPKIPRDPLMNSARDAPV